jgi:meiosis induction protein kinase IME2/SME1
MTVAYDVASRAGQVACSTQRLKDKFEVLRQIGSGAFGTVDLARARSAGASIEQANPVVRDANISLGMSPSLTLHQVAIKTIETSFTSFDQCVTLREVVFLRSVPSHPNLISALDIFLDPTTKKLHIATEYMDGDLCQLIKAQGRRYFDSSSVKSILLQVVSGLEHIHHHNFFHRDIKPENILVSACAPRSSSSTPRRYTVKLADFGLARKTNLACAYTSYVSTRWYRPPEILLRAGEQSTPVDIWAVGAIAVEIATLKPLFPGMDELDQVWRICNIVGSPGSWMNQDGARVGGGKWEDGAELARKLGFSFRNVCSPRRLTPTRR